VVVESEGSPSYTVCTGKINNISATADRELYQYPTAGAASNAVCAYRNLTTGGFHTCTFTACLRRSFNDKQSHTVKRT
jgi:hypothetical protein